MMKWIFAVVCLISSVNAHAWLMSLKSEAPVLGVESLWLSTMYDKEDFKGYITRGVKYTYVEGRPFFVLFEESHFDKSHALMAHERAKKMMIEYFVESLKREHSVLVISKKDDSSGYYEAEELSDIREETSTQAAEVLRDDDLSDLSEVDSPGDYPFGSGDERSDSDWDDE